MFGRHSHTRLEAPLQLSPAHPKRRRGSLDIRRPRKQARRLVHQRVGTPPLQFEKPAFEIAQSRKFRQALQTQIAGRDYAIRQFLRRHAEQLGGAARPETDSHDPGDTPAPAEVEDR